MLPGTNSWFTPDTCAFPLANRTRNWGSDEFQQCEFNSTWQQLAQHQHICANPKWNSCTLEFQTGGLGDLEAENYSSWLCAKNHTCADGTGSAWFCFVFNEQSQQFVPWYAPKKTRASSCTPPQPLHPAPLRHAWSPLSGARPFHLTSVDRCRGPDSILKLVEQPNATYYDQLCSAYQLPYTPPPAPPEERPPNSVCGADNSTCVAEIQSYCAQYREEASGWSLEQQREYLTLCAHQVTRRSRHAYARCRFTDIEHDAARIVCRASALAAASSTKMGKTSRITQI